MSCTRLFIKGKITERLFCIFDRDKPYELVLSYKRLIPKTEGGSGIGFGTRVSYTDVQKIFFTKERTYRLPSEQACKDMLFKVQNDMYCYKCGDVNRCAKNMRLLSNK